MKIFANKAFTLIELLVVVLIIGILAAIAVPQYQKAVLKTKYNRLKSQAASLQEATIAYTLSHNGNYPPDLDSLDITRKNDVHNRIDGVYCENSPNVLNPYIMCIDSTIHMSYLIRSDNSRVCVPYGYTLQKEICKEETGNEGNNSGWYFY